jgi:hypothetical protein
MMPVGRPKFEVVVAATATERRLVSATTIRALTGIPSTGEGAVSDVALTQMIDAALITMARSCKLAKHGASPPTLAQESVRATWTEACWRSWPYPAPYCGHEVSTLLLPWRAPITAIAIAEGETELVEDTDFRLLGAGVVERIGGSWPTSGTIVVDYTAGFVPTSDDPSYDYDGEPMPADLVSLLADQVRMASDRAAIDLNLRSEDITGIGSWTFNVAGGSAIDTGGLLLPLYDALSAYRAPPSIG